jgi:serine/threonine protein kinase
MTRPISINRLRQTRTRTTALERSTAAGRGYFELDRDIRIGRFIIDREIGRGGHGVVYSATDTMLKRDVALKTIVTSRYKPRTAAIEARLLSRINNPHVVTLFDVLQEPLGDVLVMELVAGPTLLEVSRRTSLRPTDVVRLGAQLASGLHAMHSAGIVHGDIKPANLRLAADGRLKILDLGVARSIESPEAMAMREGPAVICGTVAYMSPEQLRGAHGDVRSDIWSVGAVLFELATGQRFTDPQTSSSPLNCRRTGIQQESLTAVIARATDPDPCSRFQSAFDLRLAIRRTAASRGGVGRSRTFPSATHDLLRVVDALGAP